MGAETINVLLVEDNPADARLLHEILVDADPAWRGATSAGFHLTHVRRLSAGLERLTEECFDIILLDLRLPDASGLGTVTRMLAAAPDVPIVVLTSLSDEVLAVTAVAQGAQDYLVKGEVEGGHLARSMRYAIERKRTEQHLRGLVFHDPLTGLPNRRLFADRISVAVAEARRRGRQVAVLFIDVDHLKRVNDELGHSLGDGLLRGIAERIKGCVRACDTVARQGGDEFLVLAPGCQDAAEATEVAQRILEALRPPFPIDGREIRITASVGISFFPQDGDCAEALLASADAAMYRAKAQGRDGYAYCRPALEADGVRGGA